jgi:hypothetical protein
MLVMADTCEAHSLAAYLTPEETPEVGFVCSSLRTENSYSLDSDKQLGVLISDRWTHYVDSHLTRAAAARGGGRGGALSIAALMESVQREHLMSHIGQASTMSVPLSQVSAKDFLMDPAEPVRLQPTATPLSPAVDSASLPQRVAAPAGGSGGGVSAEGAMEVVAAGHVLVSTEMCRAVGGAAALALVAGAAASTLL